MAERAEVIALLEEIAPLALAADWDNVGLLIEGAANVEHLHLCIDLTEAVLAEALEAGADLIVTYHPPIFGGLKRLGSGVPLQRMVMAAVRAQLNIYVPHTALDAAAGGLNDWLVDALAAGAPRVPLAPDAREPTLGLGRRANLPTPLPVAEVVTRLKAHLGIDYLRLAGPQERLIGSMACCPGAGGSLLAPVRDADLLLTGEWRHHDVLAAASRGQTVILTDHTHTERGYLPVLACRLREGCGLRVTVSQVDDDPLTVL